MRNGTGKLLLVMVLFACAAAVPAAEEGFGSLEQRVIARTLPNGIRLLLLPRPGAPVISMVTYADVGSVNENQNATGLAHIFEHMAFKGTTTIGTRDYAREAPALEKVEQAFLALRAERLKRPGPDEGRLKELEAAFAAAEAEAQQFVVSNELGEILEREGAEGLNAFTNFDQTIYLYSLPSNKLELWAALEADRFANPVLREFYKEKGVIMEERRMGESQPTQRLLEDFMAVAFKASMYRSMVIGHMSDLAGITRTQAEEWFRTYYRGNNLTMVVVGDMDPEKAFPILEKHLGKIPPGRSPEPVVTVEPPQRAEKRITMEDPAQPLVVIGYHRPDINHKDSPVLDAVADILGGGRSSRLYTALVKEKQIALATGAVPQIMRKFPGLFAFYAVPNRGRTNQECEAAIEEQIERLKAEPVTPEDLAGVKARAKAGFLQGLDSNLGLALGLANAQNLQGDWRELFRTLPAIEKVTAEDIQRVARQTFVKSNRTVGSLETAAAASR